MLELAKIFGCTVVELKISGGSSMEPPKFSFGALEYQHNFFWSWSYAPGSTDQIFFKKNRIKMKKIIP